MFAVGEFFWKPPIAPLIQDNQQDIAQLSRKMRHAIEQDAGQMTLNRFSGSPEQLHRLRQRLGLWKPVIDICSGIPLRRCAPSPFSLRAARSGKGDTILAAGRPLLDGCWPLASRDLRLGMMRTL